MDTKMVEYQGINEMNEQVSEEKPLVTFALFAYNQEKFIREAVEGALAQNYSPLKIILSDDFSPDRTFEIMQEMVAEYIGPHEILLNRNQQNMGFAGHINNVMTLATGELIVVAAGDDISLPNRCTVIANAWLNSDRKAMSIHSAYMEIGQDGNFIKIKQNPHALHFKDIKKCIKNNSHVTGATHAWARKVFEKFGPLRDDIIHEDVAIPLRSMLIGEVIYLDEPLVKYRINVGISSGFGKGGLMEELYGSGAVAAERYYIDYLQKYQDLQKINADIKLLQMCNKKLQEKKLVKFLSRKENNKFKNFSVAVLNGASFWSCLNILFKYVFPNITIQKRKITKYVREILLLKVIN